MNLSDIHTRFERQISLSDFGIESQQKLIHSKILIVGLGGLGCPAAQYLVAAGVGTLGFVDGDLIDVSNLHRQILYTNQDIGKQKVSIAASRLNALHPQTQIHIYPQYLTTENGPSIIDNYDLVLDCSDRFEARYIINDCCVALDKPFIYGAVFKYQGQVAVFNHGEMPTTLRDIFPIEPDELQNNSCNELGTLGMIPGIIGTMQALEAVKYIAQLKGVLYNEMLIFDMQYYQYYKVAIEPSPQQKILDHEIQHIESKLDMLESIISKEDLDPAEFNVFINSKNVQVIDVRNPGEWPFIDEFKSVNIPISSLESQLELLDKNKKIVLYCHVGIRSQTAIDLLKEKYHFEHVYHLKGGIVKWLAEKEKK